MSKCAMCDKDGFNKGDLVAYNEKCDTGICKDCDYDLEMDWKHPICSDCGGRSGLECNCDNNLGL